MMRLGAAALRHEVINNDEDEAVDEISATGGVGLQQLQVISSTGNSRQMACDVGWRRKRYSLPCIRLYSSLDSPGACSSTARDHVTGNQQPTTVVEVESSTGSSAPSDVVQFTLPKMVHVHSALAARRSRELMRADTEILPPTSLGHDDEDNS